MNDLGNLLNRPRLYHNIDGVGELGMGVLFAGAAAIQFLQLHSAPSALWHKTYFFLIFWGLLATVIDRGTKAIKNRITYPRTGYVELRRSDRVFPAILGSVVSALTAVALAIAIRSHWSAVSFVAVLGLVLAATYAYRLARTAPWKWIVALAMAAASLSIAILPADWLAKLAANSWAPHLHLSGPHLMGSILFLLAAYGVIFLISGAISFCLYLRHTQPPIAEAE